MSNDPESLTRQLARFTSQTRFEDLPANVVAECKRLLLDTLGCALGAIDTPSGRIALDYARLLGGTPIATVIGASASSSAPTAAYVNARLANVLDADDTFPTATHFGNSTVFAGLAVAEQLGGSGRDLITAIAVGFDVGARIGSWLGVPIHIEDGKVIGFNRLGGPAATIAWAAVGSAARMSGMDEARICDAFGIAGANSPLPSMRKYADLIDVPMYKYADAGWCASVGVSATLLANLGSTGYADILDGDNAFWRFYGSPAHDDAALLGGLGSEWQILNTTYKPWPCCRFIHYPLTAFGRLKQRYGFRPEEIEKVVVRAAPFALSAMFCNGHPTDPLNAEFSHAHAHACFAYDVPPGPLWYVRETLDAAHIRAFRDRVEIELEPSSANLADWIKGGQWRGIPGGIDIHARSTVFSDTVTLSKGDPWSAATLISDDDLRSKFRVMAGLKKDETDGTDEVNTLAARIVDRIDNIEKIGVDGLTKPLRLLARAMILKKQSIGEIPPRSEPA